MYGSSGASNKREQKYCPCFLIETQSSLLTGELNESNHFYTRFYNSYLKIHGFRKAYSTNFDVAVKIHACFGTVNLKHKYTDWNLLTEATIYMYVDVSSIYFEFNCMKLYQKTCNESVLTS